MNFDVQLEGDFYDILTYYVNLFSIKKLKEIEVFGFSITYSGHSIIKSADRGLIEFFEDFPDKKRGLDRVQSIYFQVQKKTSQEINFTCAISFDRISYESSVKSETINEFVEAMDKSTFRFF